MLRIFQECSIYINYKVSQEMKGRMVFKGDTSLGLIWTEFLQKSIEQSSQSNTIYQLTFSSKLCPWENINFLLSSKDVQWEESKRKYYELGALRRELFWK